MRILWLASLATWCILCSGQDLSLQVCQADRQTVDVGASNPNVIIGGLFPMRDPGEDGFGCGKPTTDMMQAFEAARFTINYLNDRNYVPGVQFGMKVYDTCHSPSQALQGLMRLYPQFSSSNPYCAKSSSAVTAGIVGPMSSDSVLPVADLAGDMGVGVISPRAENPLLSDTFRFPTFLRTAPSVTVLSKAIISLLDHLEWENFLVVYVDDAYGASLYQELLKSAHASGLCVSQAIKMEEGSSAADYTSVLQSLGASTFTAAVFLGHNADARILIQSREYAESLANLQWVFSDLDLSQVSSTRKVLGAISMGISSPDLNSFVDYFAPLEASPTTVSGNPWFEDWYETRYGCLLRGGINPCTLSSVSDIKSGFVLSQWVLPTMKAIFAYANAVGGICRPGVCNTLLTMSSSDFINNHLKAEDFTFPNTFPITGLRGQRIRFDGNGDTLDASYSVYNLQGPQTLSTIGSYESGTFSPNGSLVVYDRTRQNQIITTPKAQCESVGCDTCLLPKTSVSFRYSPGNVVVASLVSAHMGTESAFTCGAGIVERLAALVAAEWAVDQFKVRNPTKLQGVSLGSLVADVCPDSFVSDSFLSNLLGGDNRLVDAEGRLVSASTVKAFVDQTDNEQAMQIHNILSQYMIPEIQTGAATSMLSGETGAYFSRAIPANTVFFTAIASLLQRMDWKYVQVATYFSGMYHHQTQLFKEAAAKYGVCITGYADLSQDMSTIQSSLSSNKGLVVVVIAGISDLQRLMQVTSMQIVSGVEEWSRDPHLLDANQLSIEANGLIVFEPELSQNTQFGSWLRDLSRSEITAHPFMAELFEVINECSLNPGTRGLYSRSCTTVDTFDFYQGKTPYVIESVYLVASQLHEVIAEVCHDSNYNGLCPEFHAATDIGMKLQAKIHNSGQGVAGFEIRDGEGITDFLVYKYQTGRDYVQVGTFDSASLQLTQLTLSELPDDLSVTCPGSCVECQYLYTLQNRYYVPGDWLLVGTFSVSESGPEALQPYICGEIRESNGPQYTTAMMYAIEQVNKGLAPVSVKGVSIGGLVMDHCNNDGRVDLMVSDVFSGLFGSDGVDPMHVLSWMTDSTGSTHEAAHLLDPLGVAMLSPSATAASLMDYPTFYRTVQGDTTAVTAIMKVVKFLGFSYIQVAHSDNSYGLEGLGTMKSVAEAEGICITSTLEMEDGKVTDVVNSLVASETKVVVLLTNTLDTRTLLQAISTTSQARQSLLLLMLEPHTGLVDTYGGSMSHPILSLKLHSSDLQSYKQYLNQSPVENPHFAAYYMKLKRCNLPGYSQYSTSCSTPLEPITTVAGYQDDDFLLATINAVYASVDALDRTVREVCNYTHDYTHPCSSFFKTSNWRDRYNVLLNSANFIDDGQNNFRFLEREGNVVYDILQSTGSGNQDIYRSVGSYAGVSLSLEDTTAGQYSTVLSHCSEPCLGCVVRALNFSHTHGDIYLAGLFDVHKRGVSPFTCGEISTLHGYLLLEAFHFALNQVNEKKGAFANILSGTRLGGIGLDECGSRVRGGNLISNINNGMTSLDRDGVHITPSDIDVYIGSHDSSSSLYIARILTDLEIPQISYASTSSLLDDERVYPYFFRTVPSEENIVRAMLAFLDKNNIRYVQVLYEDTSNGLMAKELFVKLAPSYRVCVSQVVDYPETGRANNERSNKVVTQLVEEPTANTVVTFVGTSFINSVLRAVGRSPRAVNKFRFFGDLQWADNQDALYGAEMYAVDSLTIKLDAHDVNAFESYIDSKTLANSDETPWFEEYYQKIHECYTSKTNQQGYTRPCPLSPQSTINSENYQQDPGVAYVMNSVYAAAFAIHKTLEETCDQNYRTVCQAYKNNDQRRNLLRDNLEEVSFIDPVGNLFEFEKRHANANFSYNSIEQGPVRGANYYEVGHYDHISAEVIMKVGYSSSWNSDCNRDDACTECPAIRNVDTRYFIYDSKPFFPGQRDIPDDATTVIGFFDIHKQGVDPYTCGELNVEGFHNFLAFLYSAQSLFSSQIHGNDDDRGLRLIAIDTCSNSMRIDQDLFSLLQGSGLCNTLFDPQGLTINIGNIGSILTFGDANTFAAARVLEGPGIAYLSPNSPSSVLDENSWLVRTSSPMSSQMAVLSRVLAGCAAINAIYEDSQWGVEGWDVLSQHASMYYTPIGSVSLLSADGIDADFDVAINSLPLSDVDHQGAVVLMGGEHFIRRVFASATALAREQNYMWVLVTDWDHSKEDLSSLTDSRNITIVTLHPEMSKVYDFDEYVSNLRYEPNTPTGNSALMPREWYEEFYQTVHDCTLPSAHQPINKDKPECSPDLTIPEYMVHQNKYVLNTIAAMYAITDGLNTFVNDCEGRCNTGQPLDDPAHRESIRSHILAANWDLQQTLDLRPANLSMLLTFDQVYHWWNKEFDIDIWNVFPNRVESFKHKNGMLMEDYIPTQCALHPMANTSAVTMDDDDHGDRDPRNYYKYNSDGDKKYDWPIWALVTSILTGAGILVTVILFLILLFAYPYRGGTSVLGYLAILGIILIFGINFAFFVHASDAACGIRRFLMGVVYMIVFASLLIKALDNWRFSHVDYAEARYKGISAPWVLVCCALCIVLVQCIIPIIWLILRHPTASVKYVAEHHDHWWCDPEDDYDLGLVLSFTFVAFIVLITAIFSALAYDSERNNYESRWILFGCVATAGCFMVWMVVTTNASAPYRDPSVAIANFVNASVLVVVLPLRKTILLFRAKRENAEKFPVDGQNGGPYNNYDNFHNPAFQLDDIDDSPYMNS